MLQHEYEVMHAQEKSHWWFRGRRRVLLDLIRRSARGVSRPYILDFGCGTGGTTEAFTRVGDVVGVEPNAGALALAKARGMARYCQGNGTSLPFRSETFDVVVASDVLEHIGDDVRAVAEIGRVLRRGGALVFGVPAHPWLFTAHDEALWHKRRYTRAALRQLLAEGGLKEEWVSYWNTALFPAVCVYRSLAHLVGRDKPRSHLGATPGAFNEPLTGILALEAAMLRHVRMPWGLSFIGIARRA